MGTSDSPPPAIVQLRAKLATLILDPDVFATPARWVVTVDECIGLCDWLVEQHPGLVGDYYLHDGKAK